MRSFVGNPNTVFVEGQESVTFQDISLATLVLHVLFVAEIPAPLSASPGKVLDTVIRPIHHGKEVDLRIQSAGRSTS